MAEGRADTLLRQLQKRFGPVPEAVVRRVRRSSIKKLDTWLDRVLDAESLAEVFAD
jgi:hypothetical protein